ncbi:hypothetical protein A2W48_00455 [Candidatus Giovannonibacteria bacterium RIFCSPHIGHO2_12_44_12]|uniref:AFP-like domain-containing protein n=1 Tax=Candidatus Giovannonibacteria bacterium RIFCSPHIGHO2_12_44_12 TaxID=1798340 RepID=A0A1F5X1P6_9BACT|nr:MAG: hypothetical protein A2W48_00455 [Candidatus Giovannonibacteria bacterium RIFCSPHIGHO2_12_44_12]
MKTIKIGKIEIGEGYPAAIIAEGCDNHGGSLAKAKEMAHAAKEAGADIIKFQLHLPDEEMVKSEIEKVADDGIFKKWGSLYGFVEKFLLKPEEHAELKDYCEKIGIQYLCTPFSLKAAQLLNEMGAEGFKIGSGETEDLPMIEEVAKFGKPMMISTGMTTLEELDAAVNAVKAINPQLCLAHCISTYPIKALSTLKFGTIPYYQKRYGVPIGWSDHSAPEGIYDEELRRQIPEAEILAVALGSGATFIEKHFTLDRNADDGDSFFSHDPSTLKNLVKNVRHWEEALASRNEILKAEEWVRLWAKRSLVAAADIPVGAALSRAMFTSKRPGTGIRSKDYKSFLGRKTARAIQKGEMLRIEDFEK